MISRMANRFCTASAILALAIAGWAMTGIGCGDGLDDCQEAQAQIYAKFRDCNQFSQGDDGVGPVQCTDAVGKISLCQARVIQGFPCVCLRYDMTKCTPAELQIFQALYLACD